MSLTEVKTEKVLGRIKEVQIGKSSTSGVKITKGAKAFSYARVHDARTAFNVSTKTTSEIYQPHSNFDWRLEFLSDCRQAFFATDVQAAGGNQYAMTPNGDSNLIEYFRVLVPIEDEGGTPRTRTYTITNGYALRNGCDRIGNDEVSTFWYEGIAEQISYSDTG